ncbi:MAG: SLC13 family permease [Rhodospirillales bacterium]
MELLLDPRVQIAVLLAGGLVAFVRGMLRPDVVALIMLLAAFALGLVPAGQVFSGFANPAVVTVVLVLILSQGLTRSGAIERLIRYTTPQNASVTLLIGAMGVVAAVMSSLMNNVGALAIMMPVAIQAAVKSGASPTSILMPVSSATILGGMMTLIGTPPNLLVSQYRADAHGAQFGFFDFAPVGLAVALAGIAFMALAGWRILPRERRGSRAPEDQFEIAPYLVELVVPDDAPAAGKLVRDLEDDAVAVELVAMVRGKAHIAPPRWQRLAAGDVLLVRGEADAIDRLGKAHGLVMSEQQEEKTTAETTETAGVAEAVVMPHTLINGLTAEEVRLRTRYGIGLLGVSRSGRQLTERLASFRFATGDVLLLQGPEDRLADAIVELGCAPLASRGIRVGSPSRAAAAAAVFAAAIAATAFGAVPVTVAFAAAVALYVLAGVLRAREAYAAVDWPVVVLLGCLIPVGGAMETTGLARTIADAIVITAEAGSAVIALAVVLVVTMMVSDVLNNAATAVIMAPVADHVARTLGVAPDAFLMAVAIGASCAFLTPIGHQNNLLIMGPGGYRFGDYWRFGLPLEVIVVAVSMPILLLAFPL